jgi:fibronectin type 3 domain-containing protein
MKNFRKGARQGIVKTLVLFTLLVSATVSQSFTVLPSALEDHCKGPAPTNLQITKQTSNSVSFSWDGVGDPDRFKIWYYRSEGNYQSPTLITVHESISFTLLPAGTYDFYFVAIHGGEESSIIVTSDLIME